MSAIAKSFAMPEVATRGCRGGCSRTRCFGGSCALKREAGALWSPPPVGRVKGFGQDTQPRRPDCPKSASTAKSDLNGQAICEHAHLACASPRRRIVLVSAASSVSVRLFGDHLDESTPPGG